jgi:potassium-transporting ATPase KdpC subunit
MLMLKHLRANLWLLGLTLLLCSVVYPLVLLGIGMAFFSDQAEGSLIFEDGKPIGSRLIGQPFKGAEFFQPRPSHAGSGYDAGASGASNWGASNPLLRSRVARQLGPIVKYADTSPRKPGQPVGPDIDTWFKQQKPEFVSHWAENYATLAEQWIKDNPESVTDWLNDKVKDWADKSVNDVKSNSSDAAKAFWKSFAEDHSTTIAWPTVEDQPGKDQAGKDKTVKKIKAVQDGPDVQSYFFDLWLQANRDAIENKTIFLEKVPADMVMASASGLDPHITLKNALYQLDGVAAKRAKKTNRNKSQVADEIKQLLEDRAEAPFGGLVGVKLINVLETNLALRKRFASK